MLDVWRCRKVEVGLLGVVAKHGIRMHGIMGHGELRASLDPWRWRWHCVIGNSCRLDAAGCDAIMAQLLPLLIAGRRGRRLRAIPIRISCRWVHGDGDLRRTRINEDGMRPGRQQ